MFPILVDSKFLISQATTLLMKSLQHLEILLVRLKHPTHFYNSSIELNDLIINWKKSQQGLSNHNLDLYFLLDLSMNQLSGEIPDTLGSLKALKLLNISHNNLYGKILASLGDLKSLESLDLSHNKISDLIPQSLTKLQQLTVLDVSNNNLTVRFLLVGKWTL